MEYEIDNEIKYTTLQIRAMLVWKGMNKKVKKWHRRKSSQGGWGMGSKEPIRRIILLTAATISENWYIRNFLVLIQDETKILQLYKKFKNFVKKGRPLGGFERSKIHFGQ